VVVVVKPVLACCSALEVFVIMRYINLHFTYLFADLLSSSKMAVGYIAACEHAVFMAALCIRAGHYIFAMWFLSSIYLFFPRLISAVADWMSTILRHMVWP